MQHSVFICEYSCILFICVPASHEWKPENMSPIELQTGLHEAWQANLASSAYLYQVFPPVRM